MYRFDKDTSEYPLLACRGCLATDVNLYHIVSCGLKDDYEAVVGLPILKNDKYPQHLCTFCKEYLLKCLLFRRKCRISYNLLKDAESNGRLLTTGLVCTIDRTFHKLAYSLVCTKNPIISHYEPIKDEKQVLGNEKAGYYEVPIINTDMVKSETGDLNVEDVGHEDPLKADEVINSVKDDLKDDSHYLLKAEKIVVKEEVEDDNSFKPDEPVKLIEFTKKVKNPQKVQSLKHEGLANAKGHNLENSFKSDESVKSVKKRVNKPRKVKALQSLKSEDFTKEHSKDDSFKPKQPIKSVRKRGNKPRKVLTCDELADFAKKHNFEVTFFTEDEQFRHMEEKKNKVVEQSRPFYCQECFKIYISQETLATHLKINHDPDLGKVCKFCKSRFKRRCDLNIHLQTHSLKYTCKECGVVTTTRNTMKNHHEGHTDKTYVCHKCGKGFPKKSVYFNHVRLKHLSDSWCGLCGESFVSERGLHRHKNLIHKDFQKLELKCDKCNKAFLFETALEKHKSLDQCHLPACAHCGDSVANEMLLRYHLIQHKKKDETCQTVECENCHVKFINQAALRCHEADCSDGKSPCLICGQNFDTQEQLDEHSKHHGDKIFKCEACCEQFTSAHLFEGHFYKVHQEELKHPASLKSAKDIEKEPSVNPRRRRVGQSVEALIKYAASFDFDVNFLTKKEQLEDIMDKKRNKLSYALKCDLCGKNYRTERSLDAHHRKHHDVSIGNHVCDICYMRYKTKLMLTSHLRTHKSRFRCRKCEFITNAQEKLRNHYNFHRGTKFICQYCGKNFTKITTYLSHVRMQHASELSWCDLCGESFIGENGIKHHKKKAHKNEPDAEYVCISCNKAFFFKSALMKHESLKRCDLSSCVKCGEGFGNQQLLRYHLIQQHRNEAVSQELECETCKVRFLNLTALKRHAAECDEGQSPCVQCGENFYTEQDLNDHIQEQHNSGEEFKCEECNKTFVNAVYFREHYNLHLKRIKMGTGDTDSACLSIKRKRRKNTVVEEARNTRVQKNKSFVCKYCPRVCTSTKSRLKHQLTSHTCRYCKKIFLSPKYLEQHAKKFHNKLSGKTKDHEFIKDVDMKIKEQRQIEMEDGEVSENKADMMNEDYTDIETKTIVEMELWNEQEIQLESKKIINKMEIELGKDEEKLDEEAVPESASVEYDDAAISYTY